LPARDELKLDDALGTKRDRRDAVGILAGARDEDADAFAERSAHLGSAHDLPEVCRTDLFLALGDKDEVDGQLSAGRLERVERREKGVLGSLLVDRAPSNNRLALSRSVYD